ncbi:hypothetical protein L7F22_017876 [Adiantum nelumboides]|nr:hypothetical protein [Adiantum nelumboides]
MGPSGLPAEGEDDVKRAGKRGAHGGPDRGDERRGLPVVSEKGRSCLTEARGRGGAHEGGGEGKPKARVEPATGSKGEKAMARRGVRGKPMRGLIGGNEGGGEGGGSGCHPSFPIYIFF